MFVFGGCACNTTESEFSHVRIFIAGDFRDAYLLEFVDGNVFNITAFDGVRVPVNAQEDLLYDFFATPTMMHSRLVASRNSGLEQGYLRRIRDEGTIELSQRQTNTVQRLIRNVASGEADMEFASPLFSRGLFRWVWAIIDGEMYWTMYTGYLVDNLVSPDHFEYRAFKFNHDLLLLAYELIDLSPIDLGLETP